MNMSTLIAPTTAADLRRCGLATSKQFAEFLGMSEGTARERLQAAHAAGLVTRSKMASGKVYWEVR